MKTTTTSADTAGVTALELGFPAKEISRISEQESWRKEINRPIYHIHKWWATRLGSVFRAIALGALSPAGTDVWKAFYEKHHLNGKIVLDPFMGSGTTLGEVIKLGAKAIGCDINPVSSFLVRQAFASVSEERLRHAFGDLEVTVAKEIQHYYQTQDPITEERIPVLYFFWVKVVTIPNGETLPLLSRYVFSQDAYPAKKPRAQIVCASCWGLFEGRYDATAAICPHCKHEFNPQAGPASGQYVTSKGGEHFRIKDLLPKDGTPLSHRLYAMLAARPDGEKIYLAPRKADLALFSEAEVRLRQEDLPLPTLEVRSGHNTDQARGYNYLHWRDFFNGRQQLCLGLLLRAILKIEEEDVREQMLCLFSSTLEFNNLFCSFKGEGTGAVRHMFSNHILKPERTPLENSVWGTDKSSGTFSSLFESRLIPAKRYLHQPFEIAFDNDLLGQRTSTRKVVVSEPINPKHVSSWSALESVSSGLMILNGDSSSLRIPDASVDAVITDPPYFDFVHYSELSDFFFAWLAPLLATKYPEFGRANSAEAGEVQHKDPRVFAAQLSSVFAECARVLKDDGVLAFSFHHSRPEGWAAIDEAVRRAGLAVVAAHPVHAEIRGSSPKNAAKSPISLDAILVCRKSTVVPEGKLEMEAITSRSIKLARGLEDAGMSISAGDRFVIAASQVLVALGGHTTDFESACGLIREASEAIQQRPEPAFLEQPAGI